VFEPLGDAGPGASTRTYLRVVVDEPTDGGYRVVSATTGPALAAMTVPDYPLRDQLAGREGMVVLRLEVAADGSVRDSHVHAATGSVSAGMAEGAIDGFPGMRVPPVEVAGSAGAAPLAAAG